MAYNSKSDNYTRAFQAAYAIVAGQGLDSDADIEDIAATVGELAEALWKVQNKFVKKNDLEESHSSSSSSGSYQKRASGGSGLTPKQEAAVKKAITRIEKDGNKPVYSLKKIEKLSSDGGQNSDRSGAIGELFNQAYED